MINTVRLLAYPLIGTDMTRLMSSSVLDFIHARCVRFQNFAYSVLKYDRSIHVPLCLECCTTPDSVYHKLFECKSTELDTTVVELRKQLESVSIYEFNFHIPLLFTDDRFTRNSFFQLIETICQESAFDDELLTHTYKKCKGKKTAPSAS